MKSRLTGKAIVAEWPDSGEKLLIVDIDIDCPSCGEHSVRFAGHHLRALRDVLIEFIDLHPELTGSDAGVERISQMTFRGTSTPTPEDN